MISVMYSNAAYTSNAFFYGERKKFNLNSTGSTAHSVPGKMWLGDILCGSGGSRVMQKMEVPNSMILRSKTRSGKLEEIKKLIASGSYRIDAEKLAEKMLGNRVGLRMVN